jgi:hypothetical protein
MLSTPARRVPFPHDNGADHLGDAAQRAEARADGQRALAGNEDVSFQSHSSQMLRLGKRHSWSGIDCGDCVVVMRTTGRIYNVRFQGIFCRNGERGGLGLRLDRGRQRVRRYRTVASCDLCRIGDRDGASLGPGYEGGVKRAMAPISSSIMASPPWPSSPTTMSSLLGQALWSFQAVSNGELTSNRP